MYEFGIHDGQIDQLLRRMPANGDLQEGVSWLIELFELWRNGQDTRVSALRHRIAAQLASNYGVSLDVELPHELPEGHTMQGRWLLLYGLLTLRRTHYGTPLADNCQTFLVYAKPWVLSI